MKIGVAPQCAVVLAALVGFGSLFPSARAAAQSFPAKPMRIISTTSAGGVNDTISRAYAQQISRSVGQSVIVENRPGAGSILGMLALKNSPPDGYTVAITTPEPLVFNPLLFTSLPYDPDNDFAPIAELARGESVIIASASLPANNFQELVAYGKANPGKLNFATWGPGSLPAVYGAWINRQAGLDMQPIAYKGAVPSIASLLSGESQLTYMATGFVLAQIRAGKLKAIATVGQNRTPLLPDIPSLAELNSDPGLQGFFGVYAPARTPAAIRDRLSAEFVKASGAPRVREILAKITHNPVGGDAAEFAETNRMAKVTVARVFKELGIRPSAAPQ